MTIVQQSRPIDDPVVKWWADVHDTAVQLERILTPDPETIAQDSWALVMTQLQSMASDLKRIPHTSKTRDAHQTLIQAVDYLYRSYQQLEQSNAEEARFYYNNALIQVTQLHEFLLENNLTI